VVIISSIMEPKDRFYIRGFVYYVTLYAGVVELVDTQDLKNLSALLETIGVELFKFGETC